MSDRDDRPHEHRGPARRRLGAVARRATLSLVALLGLAVASGAAGADPLHTGDAGAGVDLGPYIEVLEDPGGSLDIEGAAAPRLRARYVPYADLPGNPGFSDSTWWVRLAIDHADGARWLLELGYPLLDHLTLYQPASGGGWLAREGGDGVPYDTREVLYRNPVFALPAEPGARVYYLRVAGRGSIQFPLRLWRPDAFAEHVHRYSLGQGMFYGVMLVIVLYNLFLLVGVRDTNYLYYVAYVASFALFQASITGIGFEFLWPGSTWLANHGAPLFADFATLSALLFSQRFLDTPRNAPRMNRLIQAAQAMVVLSLGAAVFADPQLAARMTTLVGMSMVLVVLPAGLLCLKRGYRPARWFVLAWTVFLVFAFLNGLMLLGLVPFSFFSVHGIQIGSALEAILLSLALADRINLLERHRRAAVRDANRHLRVLNEELETRVRERTVALLAEKERAERYGVDLERKNRLLTELAMRDGLTGLLNHRAFMERLDQVIADAGRHGYDMAVMMIDADHFKRVNDRYGHQVGDEVLRAIGEVLVSGVRSSDLAARYGGEEFACTLSHANEDEALSTAERLREAVAAIRIEGHPELFITASVGIACMDRDDASASADELLERADRALYAAKHGGRNQVRLAHPEHAPAA